MAELSVPSGGGAISGIGETFQPDLHTGTGNLSVPIPLPPGRGALTPQLALAYSSGAGNGPFGLGWSLAVPRVSRRTDRTVPLYDDDDVFVLSGAEELVTVPLGTATPSDLPPAAVATRYRPRTESGFARIVHVTAGPGSGSPAPDYWDVTSPDGLRSRYGTAPPPGAPAGWTDPASIRSPEGEVFSWLLSATWDSFGNTMRYAYRTDDDGGAQRYLKTISYADYGDPADPSFGITVTIRYTDATAARPDPFSERRPGFDLRTTLRATAIEVETIGSGGEPMTVVELTYADQLAPTPTNGVSLLASIRIVGHAPGADSQALPPLTFDYQDWDPRSCRYQRLPDTLPPLAMTPSMDVADLFGDGLPGVLQLDSAPRYWRNRGSGDFDRPRALAHAPAGGSLGGPGVALTDVDADGRPELTVADDRATTVWPFAPTTDASTTAGFSARPTAVVASPTLLLTDPRVRTVDVDGDHCPDLLLVGERAAWAPGDGRGGFAELRPLAAAPDPLRAVGDPRVHFADMTGDGLTDVVLVEGGRVQYWPSRGHGRYDRVVEMVNAPVFPDAEEYPGLRLDPQRLLLGDVVGDGTADIVYVGDRQVTIWVNNCGNGFADPVVIPGCPRVDDTTRTRLVDVLGAGTDGILYSGVGASKEWAFLDLTGGLKPYLLSGVDNHRGAQTAMTWATSTSYATADRTAGRPWRTPLPFPVHVLASTRTLDQFAETVTTASYRYHDGYWDPVDREFRGFGCVEQTDTLTPASPPPPAPASATPLDRLTPTSKVPAGFDAEAAGNLLRNWSFESEAAGGSSELVTPDPADPEQRPFGGGQSAAAEWTTWNNSPATTRTDLQTSLLPQGKDGKMLHVVTSGAGCGIVQTPFHDGISPRRVVASVWVKVIRGRVHVGTGNGGDTGADAVLDATGVWTLVRAGNGRSPANEFIVYADTDGGAEFFVDHAWISDADSTPSEPVSGPPLRTVTWFHLGPVGRSLTDWTVLDPSPEYWQGDPVLIPQLDLSAIPPAPSGSAPLALREAIRAARGHVLRTETYADDGDRAADRPYEVHDASLEIVPVLDGRLSDDPAWHAQPVTLARETCSRTTSWDRGTDPMTHLRGSGDYDDYNRPGTTVSLGVPRGRDPRADGGEPCLATVSYTRYATRDDEVYRLDATATIRRHEAIDPGNTTVADFLSAALAGHADGEVRALECRYYDGDPFIGLELGELGDHALPMRIEQLVITGDQLRAAAAPVVAGGTTSTPFPYLRDDGAPSGDALWGDYPSAFRDAVEGAPDARGSQLGYVWHDADATFEAGYYAQTGRHRYDVQEVPAAPHPRGLLVTSRDGYGEDTTTSWDTDYALLPVAVVDPNGLTTSGTWDTRIFKPSTVLDPNGNTTAIGYTPLGLPEWIARLGKQDASAGDTTTEPGQRFSYDLTAWDDARDSGKPAQPVSVTTVRRIDHRWTLVNDEDARRTAAGEPPLTDDEIAEMFGPTEANDHPERFIRTIEYSDGLSRLLQKRIQADDLVVTDTGLPEDQSPAARTVTPDPAPATGSTRVVVSGWKIYDNKGRPVRTYEPFFDTDWDYRQPLPAELASLAAVTQHYDPRGRPTTTIAADGTQTRVVRGTPGDLNDPDVFEPNPWDVYTYDADDNAGRTHPTLSLDYVERWNTPTSTHVDALGRTVRTVQRGLTTDLETSCTYDIDGHITTLTDALGRLCGVHLYDCAGTSWANWLLDAGTVRTATDAVGGVVERRDDKNSLTLAAFDAGHRPIRVWARDRTALDLTLRQVTVYGDDAATSGLTDPESVNAKGRVVIAYDEAGRLSTAGYDIDGNAASTTREVIDPSVLVSRIPAEAADGSYPVDWQPDAHETLAQHAATLLDVTRYEQDVTFDALARRTSVTAPLDGTGRRAMMRFSYGPGGAVTAVTVDGIQVVAHIVYDAHGRRSLVQLGNGVLQRYLYDPWTLRLRRAHAQVATSSTPLTWTTTGPVLQDHLYRYDVDGNLSVLGDRTPGSGLPVGLDPLHSPDPDALNRVFAYDPLGRLVSATGRETDTAPLPPWVETPRGDDVTATRSYTETYTYDDVGNLTVMDHRDPTNVSPYTRTFTSVDASNRLATLTKGADPHVPANLIADYTWDAAGNLLSEMDNRLFEWDHANRLATFRNQTSPDAAPTVYAMYRYDASGERVLKIVRKGNGVDEVTAYLGGFERTFVGSIGGTMTAYDELHVIDHDSRLACLVRGTPHPRDPFQTELTRYQLGDHLGSVVATLDDTAAMLSREEYLPYGETSFGSYARKRYRYANHESDDANGLNYDGARYYARYMCRWISADPAQGDRRARQTINPLQPQTVLEPAPSTPRTAPVDCQVTLSSYAYARNCPITYVDPDGRDAKLTETLFGMRHPSAALAIGSDTPKSTNISTTARRFSTDIRATGEAPGLKENAAHEGSQVNAYRHALWQAMITVKFGPDIARDAGFAHEKNPHAVDAFNPSNVPSLILNSLAKADEAADLLNNQAGQAIGLAHPGANNVELAAAVLDVFHSPAGLWTASKIAKGYVVHRTSIDQKTYAASLTALKSVDEYGRPNGVNPSPAPSTPTAPTVKTAPAAPKTSGAAPQMAH